MRTLAEVTSEIEALVPAIVRHSPLEAALEHILAELKRLKEKAGEV